MTRVVLDCDTGTDDAVAIMLAALHPDLDLLAVTTVHGNHPVTVTTDNTLRVLEHVGRGDVPVYAGSDRPCAPRPAPPDPRVLPPHLALPETTLRAQGQGAADFLAGLEAPVTLVCTGPATNLALALERAPDLADRVDRVVLLAGSDHVPSVTPLAERNVWNDPVALQRVLDAGFRDLTLVPLDATFRAQVTAEDARRLAALDTPAGAAAAALVHERIEQYAHDRQEAPVHDPLAVALLVDPDVVRLEPRRVRVDLAAGAAYGRTRIDHGTPNALVATDPDRARFVDLLLTTFA